MSKPTLPFTVTASVNSPVQLTGTDVEHPDAPGIELWVERTHRDSLNTRRAYRREALRFLAWVQSVHGMGHRLGQVTSEDAIAYSQFLQAPSYVASTYWEPLGFTGMPWRKALSDSSCAQALTTLSGLWEMLSRLTDSRGNPWIQQRTNPFYRLSSRVKESEESPTRRALSYEEWSALLETIASIEDRAHATRCRWIFMLAYYTFMRRTEMASLTMGQFQPAGRSGQWKIAMKGKGRKFQEKGAPAALMLELQAYRRANGLADLPDRGDPMPAILSMRGGPGVTGDAIYKIMGQVFKLAATRHPAFADTFQQASPHWIRHTGVTHALDANVPKRLVQAQAGHESPTTTDRYDTRDIVSVSTAMDSLPRFGS